MSIENHIHLSHLKQDTPNYFPYQSKGTKKIGYWIFTIQDHYSKLSGIEINAYKSQQLMSCK